MRVHQSERQCHKGRFPCSLLFSPQFIIVGQVFLSASVLKCGTAVSRKSDFCVVAFCFLLHTKLHVVFVSGWYSMFIAGHAVTCEATETLCISLQRKIIYCIQNVRNKSTWQLNVT